MIVLACLATSLVSYADNAGSASEPALSAGQPLEPGRVHSRVALRQAQDDAAAECGLSSTAAPAGIATKLSDGHNVLVDVCDEGIFRVRISPRKEFEESLLERYGCIKTDWKKVKTDVTIKGAEAIITNGKYSLTVNKKTGVISLKDAKGKAVIKEIRLLDNKDKVCDNLREVINKKWEDLNVIKNDGGIIGDDEGKFANVDKREIPGAMNICAISIKMEDGERFYGGGSTSRDHIQHRGELLRMWVTYQHTEIPMPFMMSSRGWGIYDNTTRKSFFDVGSVYKDTFNIVNCYDEADFFLMAGEDMPAILNAYTTVTGRTYVLPKWAYGLCFGPNMREEQFDILHDAAMFRQIDVPCDVFWLEPQWMAKRYDFTTKKRWNYDRFSPEPYWVQDQYPKQLHHRLFIGKLRSMGFHLGLWLCEEYDLSLVEEDLVAMREGRDTSGQEHWMDHLKNFMDQGVQGFKLDPARTIDNHPDWKYYNGQTDDVMHNLNQVLLPKQMAELGRNYNLRKRRRHQHPETTAEGKRPSMTS